MLIDNMDMPNLFKKLYNNNLPGCNSFLCKYLFMKKV